MTTDTVHTTPLLIRKSEYGLKYSAWDTAGSLLMLSGTTWIIACLLISMAACLLAPAVILPAMLTAFAGFIPCYLAEFCASRCDAAFETYLTNKK